MSVGTSDTSVTSLLEAEEEPAPPNAHQAAVLRWAAVDSVEAASKFLSTARAEECDSDKDSMHIPSMELRLEVASQTVVRLVAGSKVPHLAVP